MTKNLLKSFLLIAVGILLIASVNAATQTYAEYSDRTSSATITDGQSISFNAGFYASSPMTINMKMYKSSYQEIHNFFTDDGGSKTINTITQPDSFYKYKFSNTYTIDSSIYGTTGSYFIKLSSSEAGSQSEYTLFLTVNPSIPTPPANNAPVITILGSNPAIVQVHGTYSDAGATASDVEDGNLNSNIITTNNVNVNILGTYTITYSVTDSGGRTATATRTVNVVDTIAPVITILGNNPLRIVLGNPYTELGATVTDNYDIALTVIASGSVNTNVIGTYTVTYNSTDSSGNSGTATRTVNVVASGSGGGGSGGSSNSGGIREIVSSPPTTTAKKTVGYIPTIVKKTANPNAATLIIFYVIILFITIGIFFVIFLLVQNLRNREVETGKKSQFRETYY